ncbi:E4 ORF3 [simian adenovirus 55]|uniref:E4 ORF3 n=1 Tax=simian adenovirus 55 TaxID=2848082 RepID=A0A1L3INZ5_9ADEN|nr:E4 ORF3 [Simian mastadenovirus WIV19]APG53821.1 E4 ORF3 [Simian mastadenovirus WIV19]
MKACLRLAVEGALVELFAMAGLNFREMLINIIREWKRDNYLGVITECSMMIHEEQNHVMTAMVFVDVRVDDLLQAVVNHLENRIMFDLAVSFHQETGDRCHLRDLVFEVLHDQLE